MEVTKKHTLYYRHSDGSNRRLDKKAKNIYFALLEHFIDKGGNQAYMELNKDVKRWSEYKPLEIAVPLSLEAEFKTILPKGHKSLTILSNSTWRPIATLTLKLKIQI